MDIAGRFSTPNLSGEIPHYHPDVPPKVIIGEPCIENPCSYDAVQNVPQHTKAQCKIDQTRKWTTVGCDGLPYILGSRIIELTEVPDLPSNYK